MRIKSSILIGSLFLLWFDASTYIYAQTSNVTIDDIHKAWKNRQDHARTIYAEWTMKRTIAKESMMTRVDNVKQPPRDLLVDHYEQLSIDGIRFRYDTQGANWEPARQEIRPYALTFTLNGDKYIDYIATPTDSDRGTAHLRNSNEVKQTSALNILSVIPILLTCRGDAPVFHQGQDPLKNYELTGKLIDVEARACVELIRQDSTADRREYLLVDRERDFVPVRMYTIVNGSVVVSLDIAYSPHSVIGWFPTRWETVFQSPQKRLLGAGRYVVSKFDINTTISDKVFDPQFKPGTRLVDTTSGVERHSVVKEDGSLSRQIVVGELERPPTDEQLLKADQTNNHRPRWLFTTIFGGTFLIFCLVAFWRRWRIRRQQCLSPTAGISDSKLN